MSGWWAGCRPWDLPQSVVSDYWRVRTPSECRRLISQISLMSFLCCSLLDWSRLLSFHYSGLGVCGLPAHFRFGFFVAALAPEALLAGTSLVAGFAAVRLLPARGPALETLVLGSVAERFRPGLEPEVPFSTLLEVRTLLSVVFLAEVEGLVLAFLATWVVAFLREADVVVLAGAGALFFSTSVLAFLSGDLELDRPDGARVGDLSFLAGAAEALEDF